MHKNSPASPVCDTQLPAGMSLRDYAAFHAPVDPERIADEMKKRGARIDVTFKYKVYAEVARLRYIYADAMLREREIVNR